jgi:hydroxymethylbilane synthase
MSRTLILGTRGSDLALYQANFIRNILSTGHDCQVDIKIIKTAGDKIDNLSFDKMEGKGFFTRELEDALLSREIDLAVHSLKDLMTIQPEGLKLGAVGYRTDRREMLLIRKEAKTGIGLIPVIAKGIIGTGSARRKCQIARLAPTLEIRDLRGNIPTRIRKLREGQYDAIIIAAAGVKRLELDLSDLEVIILEPDQFFPAPAQGILGVQIRNNDDNVDNIVSKLGSRENEIESALERDLLARFDAGCSLPLGVYSEVSEEKLKLQAVLGIYENEIWKDLKRAEVSGDNIAAVVDEVYNILTE